MDFTIFPILHFFRQSLFSTISFPSSSDTFDSFPLSVLLRDASHF